MNINTIGNIRQIHVSNSTRRWLVDANYNHYHWDNFNQSYEIVNAPSFPPSSYIYQNSSLGADSQGKTYLLQSYQNTANTSASSILIFDDLTNSFQSFINIDVSGLGKSSSHFKDMLFLNDGEIWLLNTSGQIYQLEPNLGEYAPFPILLD